VAAGERKRGRGEGKSEQNESEIEKGRHLRLRRVVADLTGASASRIEARVREIAGGGELLERSREKGEKTGLGSGLYSPDGVRRRRKGSGARRWPSIRALSMWEQRRRWLAVRARAIGGAEKGRSTGKKEGVRLTGGTRGQ